jgi:3-phenylpropionate/cinnamic acid dioxygenase small subunit
MVFAEECRALVAREARLLDERRFEEWLALYTPDCEYWVPAWHDDAPTTDPRTELSLIYYTSRKGLEERVWRITSGLSAASNLIPRTAHLVASVEVVETDGESARASSPEASREAAFSGVRESVGESLGEPPVSPRTYGARVNAAFSCHTIRGDRTHTFFGLYDFTLRRTEGALRIARKRIVVMNDVIPNVLDVYSI